MTYNVLESEFVITIIARRFDTNVENMVALNFSFGNLSTRQLHFEESNFLPPSFRGLLHVRSRRGIAGTCATVWIADSAHSTGACTRTIRRAFDAKHTCHAQVYDTHIFGQSGKGGGTVAYHASGELNSGAAGAPGTFLSTTPSPLLIPYTPWRRRGLSYPPLIICD